MLAVQQDAANGKLSVREVLVPTPGPGQVLVRMAASPINPSDLGALMGFNYSGTRSYPFVPGLEGSGTVVKAGPGLRGRLFVGRRVTCAAELAGDGAWAEYMVTSASQCIPLNHGVSMEQGATLLVNPLSALAFLELAQHGRHRAVVSTAAASALGGMIARLFRRHAIPVIHIVRRDAQVRQLRAQGAEHVLDSSTADFDAQLQALTKRLHATLLLDAIGGTMTQQLAEAAPRGSTILLYSRLSLQDCMIDARTALVKDLHFDGWFLSNWLEGKSLLQSLRLAQRVQSLAATDLHTPIRKRVPLSGAQHALEAYVADMTAGKMLLVADPQAVPVDANSTL